MSVQLKKMEGKLRSVDLVVEVHDARIALTGRNPEFYQKLYAIRPHVLVMNKMDLIDMKKHRQPIEEYYYDQGVQHIVWTDCKRKHAAALRDLREVMLNCLRSEQRFNRQVRPEYLVMVVGIPNVGKSSVINALRGRNLGRTNPAVQEGNRPGVTIRVQNRVKILDRPPLYMVDTPGVLSPSTRNVDDTMKLAICDLILESATKPDYVADYLLYWLNKTGDFSYLKALNLTCQPTDDIQRLFIEICKKHDYRTNCLIGTATEERWDFDRARKQFIELFRRNLLADMFLDKDRLEELGLI
uniref:Mitochondrial GTPase 1 n=1 Tax=Panagrellus redivivus TaxID=6233 RepID=A0A7E4ZVK3_PANRE